MPKVENRSRETLLNIIKYYIKPSQSFIQTFEVDIQD